MILNDNSNIILTGYRGTGKTTISEPLAKKLKMDTISTDNLIEKKMAMSILDIVKKYGWDRFREIETEVVKEQVKRENCVIDCGGGIVERSINVERLKSTGVVILLEADIEDIIIRIKGDKNRPPHTGDCSFEEEVKQVLKHRKKKYESFYDMKINTSMADISTQAGIDTVVNSIITILESRV